MAHSLQNSPGGTFQAVWDRTGLLSLPEQTRSGPYSAGPAARCSEPQNRSWGWAQTLAPLGRCWPGHWDGIAALVGMVSGSAGKAGRHHSRASSGKSGGSFPTSHIPSWSRALPGVCSCKQEAGPRPSPEQPCAGPGARQARCRAPCTLTGWYRVFPSASASETPGLPTAGM